MYVPIAQAVHGVSPVLEAVPGEHIAMQSPAAVAPVARVDVKAPQAVQDVAPEAVWYCPTAQDVHGTSPVDENDPAGQIDKQLDGVVVPTDAVEVPAGQDTHDVDVVTFWYVPMGHDAHGASPLDEKDPRGHGAAQSRTLIVPVAGVEMPAPQEMQLVADAAGW